jgi:hypothetical protein
MKKLIIALLFIPAIAFGGQFKIYSADTYGVVTSSVRLHRTILAVDTDRVLYRSTDHVSPAPDEDLKIVPDGDGFKLEVMTEADHVARQEALQAASDYEVDAQVDNMSARDVVQMAVITDFLNEIINGRTNAVTLAEVRDALKAKGKEMRGVE